MDLAKFVSLPQSASLYFPSVAQLAVSDPYEGRFPHAQAVALSDPKSWKIGDLGERVFTPEESAKILNTMARTFIPQAEAVALYHTYVSCWHANPAESDAMWRLYSLQGQGIAVCTTFKHLRESLDAETKTIFAGKVTYLDYGWRGIDMEDQMHVVFHKRESFAHELEVRLAYQIPTEERKALGPTGISVPVDLGVAIDRVLVSPAAPEWVVDVVANLLERYGLTASLVSQSPLYRPRRKAERHDPSIGHDLP